LLALIAAKFIYIAFAMVGGAHPTTNLSLRPSRLRVFALRCSGSLDEAKRIKFDRIRIYSSHPCDSPFGPSH